MGLIYKQIKVIGPEAMRELTALMVGKVCNRIINEIEAINRVVYDISSKPPSTIEWE